MPPSFLAYVAENHKLKFEDVATDALAFVFENSLPARIAFLELIKAIYLPSDFSIETRRDTGGFGLPDLILADKSGRARVIVESKFTAGLTPKQPAEYLQYLEKFRGKSDSALLVFLVPESRVGHYLHKVRERSGDIPCFQQSLELSSAPRFQSS